MYIFLFYVVLKQKVKLKIINSWKVRNTKIYLWLNNLCSGNNNDDDDNDDDDNNSNYNDNNNQHDDNDDDDNISSNHYNYIYNTIQYNTIIYNI